MRHPLALAAVGLCVLGVAGWLHPAAPAKDFTEKEVTEIKASLARLNPTAYRVVLPVYRNKVRVGSETIGSLPLTEVRRIASLRKVTLREQGNLQVILTHGEDGGGGGGGDKNGPGSHINSDTPAKGRDVINRIQLVVSHLDQSRYVFIH